MKTYQLFAAALNLTMLLTGCTSSLVAPTLPVAPTLCHSYLDEALESDNMLNQNMYDSGVVSAERSSVQQRGTREREHSRAKGYTYCRVLVKTISGKDDYVNYTITNSPNGENWVTYVTLKSEEDADAELDRKIDSLTSKLGTMGDSEVGMEELDQLGEVIDEMTKLLEDDLEKISPH